MGRGLKAARTYSTDSPLIISKTRTLSSPEGRGNRTSGGNYTLLAIRLMRTGAKKRPSYRIVVKEKQSKRDGAFLENVGTYDPTRQPAEIKLKADRVRYWIERGAQPTDTVRQLIKQAAKAEAATESQSEAA
jgi:small subunit ribosomal protein S16